MTVEVRLGRNACQLKCLYCYQEAQRLANGNSIGHYDVDLVIEELKRVKKSFNLFGGEALLVPKKDLRKIWQFGLETFKKNGIQTNGALIDDEHIQMFKEYNVDVGISIDGPDELNSLRQVRGKEDDDDATLKTTAKIIENIAKVRKAGVKCGVILTLHKVNASKEKLPILIDFFSELEFMGVKSGNIHMLEVDSTLPDQDQYVLSPEENLHAFTVLAKFFAMRPDLSFVPFNQFLPILRGDDEHTTCYWNYCDPLDTQAVYGIEGDGNLSNCGRTNKEGVSWYKADRRNYSRYISLYNTPDEMGGCQGCRFWMACGGSCPGESINGDFRNKTENCSTMKQMLTFYEGILEDNGEIPITKSIHRPVIEQFILHNLSNQRRVSLKTSLKFATEAGQEFIQVPVIKTEEAPVDETP